MSLLIEIRNKIKEIMKSEDKSELSIYRGILARVQADNLKHVGDLTDEQTTTAIRKLFNETKKAHETTIEESVKRGLEIPKEILARLVKEMGIYNQYLPIIISDSHRIEELLLEDKVTLATIIQANNNGTAIGLAMQFFKTKKIAVDGNAVKEKVIELRAADAK